MSYKKPAFVVPDRIPDSEHLAQMKVFLINAQNQSTKISKGEATSLAELSNNRKAQLVQAQKEKDIEELNAELSSNSSEADSVNSLPQHKPLPVV